MSAARSRLRPADVGSLARLGLTGRPLRALLSAVGIALGVGLYSAFIELGQWLYSGAHETFAQQSVDVAAGLIGGAIGGALAGARAVGLGGER